MYLPKPMTSGCSPCLWPFPLRCRFAHNVAVGTCFDRDLRVAYDMTLCQSLVCASCVHVFQGRLYWFYHRLIVSLSRCWLRDFEVGP
jgi:hypothetical protein